MIQHLKREMREYYSDLGYRKDSGKYLRAKLLENKNAIYEQMNAFYGEHPNIHPALLKSHLHTLIAHSFEPKIFSYNPFFYEMGFRESKSWGMTKHGPALWMKDRMCQKIDEEHPLGQRLEQYFGKVFKLGVSGLCAIHTSFDNDHHTLGYTTLFSEGINGILDQIQCRKTQCHKDSEEYAFLSAAEESCFALIFIASKFAESAKKMLMYTNDVKQRQYLEMIAKTAKKIPANPPETFYEGLCMLLFTREAIATLENIGISQLGHVDRLLGELYENDLQAGRITEAEARELIGIWMLYTDIKFDLENSEWPETSTCIQLGGCDSNGKPVYNKVTQMFIEEHHRLQLVNPKLNCRFSQQSPKEYLAAIGKAVLAGHNNFVLINDDIVISGLIKSGVALQDARMFVSGGCQETMIEGFGHTEGAAIYVSIARILDLFLRREEGYDEFIRPVDCADSYEEFYRKFFDVLKSFLNLVIDQRNVRQSFNKIMMPCPMFSATQKGCIENGKDYVYGGAKYNFSTVALVGLGTLTDALYAIKTFVYDQKRFTLKELQQILENNWEGFEALRQEVIALPKYGHNHAEVDAFANRILGDLTRYIQTRKNERGGNYIPSLFVYYYYEYFSGHLRATPDGRKNYDLISPGCGPSQLQSSKDITAPIKTMSNMDFTNCGGGSAVLDVMLPASNNMNPDIFASFIYACGRYKCPTLQPNVLSKEDLLDAKIHPDRHKNLIVRISGLSAYFVALSPRVQDEIIARTVYEV